MWSWPFFFLPKTLRKSLPFGIAVPGPPPLRFVALLGQGLEHKKGLFLSPTPLFLPLVPRSGSETLPFLARLRTLLAGFWSSERLSCFLWHQVSDVTPFLPCGPSPRSRDTPFHCGSLPFLGCAFCVSFLFPRLCFLEMFKTRQTAPCLWFSTTICGCPLPPPFSVCAFSGPPAARVLDPFTFFALAFL